MIKGCCDGHKHAQVAKCPNVNHLTVGMLTRVINASTGCKINFQHCCYNFK